MVEIRNYEDIKSVVEEIKARLVNLYKGKIIKFIVYGSFARNEATKSLDIDILVVISDNLELYEVRESISNFLFDILLERDELISIIPIRESIFKSYRSPFLMSVKKEDVTV